MTPAPEGTLLVDRILADPLAVPRGLDQALRRIERGARERRSALAPLAAREDAAAAVRAAAQELERFLEDEARSPLLRALRRPLRQIAPGTPGGKSLQRCWDGLRSRAEAAVELQAALDGIRAAVARVRERFADELPRATRELLRRERLDEADLARIGRAQDVPPLHRRLARVQDELERLWSRVDPGADAELRRVGAWAEEVGPGELLALLQLRLRERERLRHERDRARTLRLLAARQVQALARVRATAAREPAHAVAERMGNLLLRDLAGASGAEDLPLWSELLCAASDALHHPGSGTAWTPQLNAPPPPEERGFGSTLFVIPIDDTYALITPELQSCVRVSNRRVKLDATVDCAVFLEPADAETLPAARLDVAPLFDGLEEAPAWYSTGQRARLRVIARHGQGWIARLARRGTLVRSGVAAWQPERRGDDRLRVLATLASPAAAAPLRVGPTGEEPRRFCGLLTVPVATPLTECANGSLRLAGRPGWPVDAVEAEEACFRAIGRRVPLTVPLWAARAHLDGGDAGGPLYVPPLGARAADLPPLRTWLASTTARPLLTAVARLWLRITEAGYALGAYHVDALAFTVGWTGAGQPPTAHAVVTDGPFAAPLGKRHRQPSREEAFFPFYAGLGCHVLPPAAELGEMASPASEVQAFALFALDALARKPLPLGGVVSSGDVAELVPAFAADFVYPETAKRLAAALQPGAGTDGVAGFIQRMEAL